MKIKCNQLRIIIYEEASDYDVAAESTREAKAYCYQYFWVEICF